MIKEVSGDILLSKAQVIAHGIAPNDHFEHGLALSLRQDYPSMAKDFRHWCHQSNPSPGEAWLWSSSDGRRIANLLTQEPATGRNGHPGAATLQFVNQSLRELKKLVQKEKLQSIALPRLATGLGGLKWEDVKPLIKNTFGDTDLTVYVYSTFVKGQAAEE